MYARMYGVRRGNIMPSSRGNIMPSIPSGTVCVCTQRSSRASECRLEMMRVYISVHDACVLHQVSYVDVRAYYRSYRLHCHILYDPYLD